MKLAKDYVRRLVAMVWLIVSCLFLWFLNEARPANLTFESFLHFSLMLVGGSSAYHFFVAIIDAPYNEGNQHLWRKLLLDMLILLGAFFVTGFIIALNKFIFPENGLLSVFAIIFIGYASVWYMAPRIELQFKKIREGFK